MIGEQVVVQRNEREAMESQGEEMCKMELRLWLWLPQRPLQPPPQ